MPEPLTLQATTTPALSCEGLRVGYGSRDVLEHVALDIPPGRWTSVVGPNGCGKSTLLRALAGLETARAGTIFLQGRRLQAWPRRERARRLAWLSQTAPITDLTAAEVVALGRFAHSGWLAHRQADDDAAAHRAMTATGSLAWATRRLSTLSGGERRRCEIARALATRPNYMLLDEPFAGIDPIAVGDIQSLVRHLTNRGIGVLITDHNVRETLGLTDRAYIIYSGEVLMEGRAEEIVNNPDVRRLYLGEEFRL